MTSTTLLELLHSAVDEGTSAHRFSRADAGIGRLVGALAAFLDAHADAERIETGIEWL